MDAIVAPGNIALVIGASSGIGLATAEALLDKGMRVIATSRDTARLDPLAEKAKEGALLPLALDVADDASAGSLLERIPEDWREIDALVVSAGHDIGGRRRFDEGTAEQWCDIINTNVNGMIRVCHQIIPTMLERKRGHVVTLGSISGFRAYRGGTIYSASKFAVRAFTESLRFDYKNDPIRITEVLPGLVRTGFAEARWGDKDKGKSFYDGAAAALEPEDIAASILFALEQPPHVNIAQILTMPTGDK